MTVKEGEGCKSALSLCGRLMEMAPVYYAMGNHETVCRSTDNTWKNWKKLGLLCCETNLLYGRKIPQSFGFMAWIFRRNVITGEGERKFRHRSQVGTLLGNPMKKEDEVTILLAHNPTYFSKYHNGNADLVLSGHLHGGIMILPFLGGVIGPDFPIVSPIL